ncbi:MAG: amidohydrolase [Planctomycetes bacterium]|nr:amidohydrolase [Planctomycetota bacterium]
MSSRIALAAILAQALWIAPLRAQVGSDWIDAAMPQWLEFYRDLHRHPELSFRETRTAGKVAEAFAAAGLTVTRNVGGLGVVGVLENGAGPTLLVRCDMDALPIGERTGLEYMSKLRVEGEDGRVGGVMHACGHDLHMSTVAAAATWLGAHRDRWRGTLVCIGQPAEERAGGAKAMLEDGLLTRFPKPDHAIALHVSADLPAGTIGWCAGPAMANVESVDVLIRGRGGHGAAPHLTIDPIPIACRFVLDLQTIVAREVPPTSPAVVTVGAINGGSKHNIIDAECRLQLTIRSYDEAVHALVKAAIERKAKAAAASSGAPDPELAFSEFTPALVNDAALTARCVAAFRGELGEAAVVAIDPAMVAEDFGRLRLAGVPIHMFRLGTTAQARLDDHAARGVPVPALHSAEYWPDVEPSLRAGVRALAAAACALLPAP